MRVLPYCSTISAVALFDPSLMGLFGLVAYSSLSDLVLSFELFPGSAFSWAFTNSFRLPWPNYLILHPWGSWTFHQPLTFLIFLTFITSSLVMAHSHFSTSHTAHRFASSLFPGSFRPVYFLKTHLFISWAYNPLCLSLELNGFSIHLLTLFCSCYCASSFFWASEIDHQHTLAHQSLENWERHAK